MNNFEAKEHLCKVASGLDSLIIGENQILGQIKRAYEKAIHFGAIDSVLHDLLQNVLFIGKKVRSETNISKGVTSYPGAVCQVIKGQPDLPDKTILIIGAGKVGSITVKKLAGLNVKKIILCNRHKDRADNFKGLNHVEIGDFNNLEGEIARADIVIAATASTNYLIDRSMLKNTLTRDNTKLLLFDLGVPRNIRDDVRNSKDVSLYNIDDLGLIIDKTIENRLLEAEKAHNILESYLCNQFSLV